MQRRKFMKDALAGLPLLVLTPTILASACNNEGNNTSNGKTVIVIGAGISGLTAAKKLKESGFNVIVLETQEKVGTHHKSVRDSNPITLLQEYHIIFDNIPIDESIERITIL